MTVSCISALFVGNYNSQDIDERTCEKKINIFEVI